MSINPVRTMGMPILICVITGLAFLPVLSNGFVNWDDRMLFIDNPDFRGLSPDNLKWMFSLPHANNPHYIPVTWITYGLDYILWGLAPAGYHLTSLVFHVLNTLLVYSLLLSFFRVDRDAGSTEPGNGRLAAAIGALLFALHPLRVEPVAWASSRTDLVAMFFVLLTLHAWLRARASANRGWYVAALVLYGLSLLSKVSGATLPVVMLLCEPFLPGAAPDSVRSRARTALGLLPFLFLSLLAVMFAFLCRDLAGGTSYWEHRSLISRIAQSAWGLCFYPVKTLWPFGLSPLYELEAVLDPSRPVYILAIAAALGATAASLVYFARWPAICTSWLSYVALSLPVMGWFQSGRQNGADRFSYLACLPFAVLAAIWCWSSLRAGSRPRIYLLAPLAAVLVLFALLTNRQCRIWHDSISLWVHAVEVNPQGPVVRNLRDSEIYETAQAQALGKVESILAAHPDDLRARERRGLLLAEKGEVDRALADLDSSLRANPAFVEGYRTRAGLLAFRKAPGDAQRALADYSQALVLRPGDVTALQRRAALKRTLGDLDGALADFSAALKLQPDHWPTLANYGSALAAKGRNEDARAAFARAKSLAPVTHWPAIDNMEAGPGR